MGKANLVIEAASAVVLVQAGSLLAAWMLGLREAWLRQYLDLFVGLAIGVLLGTVTLHLLPEAFDQLGNGLALWLVALGVMLALFCGEQIVKRLAGVHHQVGSDPHHHAGSGPYGILTASMLHSFVDGAAVATAFAGSVHVGWLTAFAVALHEVPHRVGDFSMLIHFGVPVPRALRWAAWIGLPALLGVLLVAWVGLSHADRVKWLLPVSAGSFLYIAIANLVPELSRDRSRLGWQIASLLAGVLVVLAAGRVASS